VSLPVIGQGNGFLDLPPIDRQFGKSALQAIGILDLYHVGR
jgi:hypothetical protein